MEKEQRFTQSQIRYLICLYRLSKMDVGVRNVEISKALSVSKPSVHTMLCSLREMGVVSKECFGLAHLSASGRTVAKKYSICLELISEKLSELVGEDGIGESALCGILAELSKEKLDAIVGSQSPKIK